MSAQSAKEHGETEPCHHCRGTGGGDEPHLSCPTCEGKGYLFASDRVAFAPDVSAGHCPKCGVGQLGCDTCDFTRGIAADHEEGVVRAARALQDFDGYDPDDQYEATVYRRIVRFVLREYERPADASNPSEHAMSDRVLIVFDGDSWFVRRVRVIEHDLDLDEKVYRCDKHLGGPFATAESAVASVVADRTEDGESVG